MTEVGYDGAYGNKTVIRLEDGTELWYCHQSSQSVSVGDHVSAGDVIGAVGSTGNTTGPHLHLEVRPGGGDPIDPEIALADWGIRTPDLRRAGQAWASSPNWTLPASSMPASSTWSSSWSAASGSR